MFTHIWDPTKNKVQNDKIWLTNEKHVPYFFRNRFYLLFDKKKHTSYIYSLCKESLFPRLHSVTIVTDSGIHFMISFTTPLGMLSLIRLSKILPLRLLGCKPASRHLWHLGNIRWNQNTFLSSQLLVQW